MFEKLSEKPVSEVQEEQVKRWNEIDLLGKCIKERESDPSFVFFEGPPTANGKPGIHHLMARTLKDSVCRYKTMKGYQVKRKAGWDTHGLPVEIEVEKQLGINGKKDIEKYGIKEFNEKCKESVFKYTSMWKDMTEKMAYLVDLEHPYITYDNDYIETVWWILKQFHDKGLIYEGHKILPYCPRCGTGLASHEVAQGYKEITVLTLTLKFKRVGYENEYFLAWTTTPWTLPSDTLLVMGPEIEYVRAEITEGKDKGNIFILAKELADKVLGKGNYKILEVKKGKEFEYEKYEQLMPLHDVPGDAKAFFVALGDHVETSDGTGIVHTSPAFGEDDYNVARKYDAYMIQDVDERGMFKDGTPWDGRFVMEEGLDVDIVKYLGDERIFSKQRIKHNYPHCWRCNTPLVYYANPGWYIEMTRLKDELVNNNNQVNWFPPFVGDKRFGNWLSEVKDWAISRTRYWGTPLPIWKCDCGKDVCIGSREELKEKVIEDIDISSFDMHRPYVDEVHLKCPECGKVMNRTKEVIDCWFDSGAMPFAQWHYPFENKDNFDELFPADFICEGIDQTRGWFYSLMAISTFIMNKAPYKNVLVNDLILDKQGKKMSKHVGNTVNPFEMLEKYGADALRWYLLSASPAWTPTKFDEDGVKDVISKFLGTLRNIYNFFVLYSNIDSIDVKSIDVPYERRPLLDRWIISRYNRTVKNVTNTMDSYDHMKTVRTISDFVIDDFSNWYIRRARRRFYIDEMTEDKKSVYITTYEIILGVVKMIAPFAPFISDEIYVNLTGDETVHTAMFPVTDDKLIDEVEEKKMNLVKNLVNLGRSTREEENLKVRQPLNSVLIDGSYEDKISDLVPLIEEELNVKNVIFEKNLDKYMNFSVKPNFKNAGPVLGSNVKKFGSVLSKVDPIEVINHAKEGKLKIKLGEELIDIPENFLDVRITAKEGFVVGMDNNLFTILDTTLTEELISEGLVREFISKIQQLRKQHNFEMMDRIVIEIDADEEVMKTVMDNKDYIMKETLADTIDVKDNLEIFDINSHKTGIAVHRV